ncbi:hypothetical protein PIB30_086214, partial [Stylosanthes scabra]|nr:hypothetical protein [Stylosanthes scabra]
YKELRNRKVVVENHSLDDDPSHVAILTLCHLIMGHPVERIEMFYPHNGMDFRFILPADLPAYMLSCFIGCSNRIICLALLALDGVRTFMIWNLLNNKHIVIQDTFYLDTENTQSFYAFGHHYLSIIHIYGLANKIGEMNK